MPPPPPPLPRALHASPALLAKGGREPKGKPAPKASAAAAAPKAPRPPPTSGGGGGGDDDGDEDSGAEDGGGGGGGGAKDASPAARLARQVAFLRRELDKIRGSTPSAGMLDGVSVPAYGETRALKDVAQVALRGPATLLVSPFDAALAGAIAEAIRAADLGLNPQDEGGGALRVPIPKASKETRDAAVKLVSKLAEQAKVRVRRVRAAALADIKKAAAGGSEDDAKRDTEALEKLAAGATAEVGKLAEAKRLQLEKM